MAWLIQPLLFLFALGCGLESLSAASTDGVDLKTFIFPGVLCMAVLFTAMISAASLVWDWELGFLQELLVAPDKKNIGNTNIWITAVKVWACLIRTATNTPREVTVKASSRSRPSAPRISTGS